ncbi:phage protease [Pseudomonas sp. P1B16]|uniref:phage protease n=1 Tax=Pseudomonas sp. P1B16 TaxID=2986074 RepID=UPI002A23DE3F|nr:phage protease [Pseudomonas sp. P1B16]WPM24884.1 phage protease [Pseudomonas sp. P1B16]
MKTLLALNTDLSATALKDGQPPEWVELIPAGPTIIGRDGRTWLFDDLAQALVLEAFKSRGVDLPMDWEHATEILAPAGQPAPAAGWFDQLEIREGALWGRVGWTPTAAAQVANREYRFVSPVFDYDATFMRISRLVSVGLVNKPNLFLTALNHESQEHSVPLPVALCVALGLTESATENEAIAAATQLKTAAAARNNEQPSLDKFVPRGDYELAVSRATNAEQALATRKADDHKAVVNAEIDAALKAGKITPATADYHRAACSEQAGLDRFREFVKAAPTVGDPSDLGERKPEIIATALNAEQKAVCAQLGIDPVEFAKTLKSEG